MNITPKVQLDQSIKQHTCNVCGKVGRWTVKWSWYGSMADLEDGIPLFEVCSQKCQERAEVDALTEAHYRRAEQTAEGC